MHDELSRNGVPRVLADMICTEFVFYARRRQTFGSRLYAEMKQQPRAYAGVCLAFGSVFLMVVSFVVMMFHFAAGVVLAILAVVCIFSIWGIIVDCCEE